MHGYQKSRKGIIVKNESYEEKDPSCSPLELRDFHETADTLPSMMISQESNINRFSWNFRPSPSGESRENVGGGSRTVPSSRSLSRYEEQRHPPRSQSSYLLHPEELPQGADSMHHRSSSNHPDQFMTRQTQEHNHQQYSAPPDQQYSQHADVGELQQTNHRVLQQQQHQHDDGPRGSFQSPYQASAQTTAAAQQMRLHPAYFGGMYHGNNLNQPGFASGRIIPLVAASAAGPILVSPPQISFPQPPWGSTTVDPRTIASNHFPIPPGTEVVLPDHRNSGTKRKYRVDYKCYSMTYEQAHRYIESLSKTSVGIPPTAFLRTAQQELPGNSSHEDTPPSTRLSADQIPHHQRR
jgi:hypothetical protein